MLKNVCTPMFDGGAEQGKISDKSLPAWRQAYESNPAATQAELGQLVAVGPRAAAPAGQPERDLLEKTRGVLGLASAGDVDPLTHGTPHVPAPSTSTGTANTAPQLTRTEHGVVLYGGVVTSMSDRGNRQVFYGSDWMDIDEFERLGLTPEASALSIATAPTIGREAQQRLNERMPVGPLGV